MMKQRLYKISQKMYFEGLSDEEFIMKALENTIGGGCVKATLNEDVNEHIDFWWTTPKAISVAIDAKGLHKNKRSDNSYSDNHWIEVKNVNGNDGWIYGKSDFIAFRTNASILFVKPSRLIEVYHSMVKGKDVVDSVPHDCYIPYQRSGRKDLIFKMTNTDIEKISSFIIKN